MTQTDSAGLPAPIFNLNVLNTELPKLGLGLDRFPNARSSQNRAHMGWRAPNKSRYIALFYLRYSQARLGTGSLPLARDPLKLSSAQGLARALVTSNQRARATLL